MNIHTLDQNKYLEVWNILKSRYFLRFLQNYQQARNNGHKKSYKNFPKVWRSTFTDEFYSDIENIFWDTTELKNFLREFREEMLSFPEIWNEMNAWISNEEFINAVMNFLWIYLELWQGEFSIKEICRWKIDQLISAGKETTNDINGLNIPQSLQLWREHWLFPIDSEWEIIFFLSKEFAWFNVTRQFSDQIATVARNWELLEIHNPKFILIWENDSREISLQKMELLDLFLNIYRALHGKLDEDYTISSESMDKYADFVYNWIYSQDDRSYEPWKDIFIQQEWKWWDMFEHFLLENIEILSEKTRRATLTIIK